MNVERTIVTTSATNAGGISLSCQLAPLLLSPAVARARADFLPSDSCPYKTMLQAYAHEEKA